MGLLAGKESGLRGGGPGRSCPPAANQSPLLKAQGTGNDCPHKKSATLLPSFTVTPTPTATESTASPATTSHGTTTAGATSHEPTTATHQPTTATHRPTTATHRPTTATHQPPTTPRHGNTTVHPTTSNSTATSPKASTSSPHPGPLPPPPSPSPGPQEAIGDYTWTNGSQPCVRLQARIQIGVVYPTRGGGKVKPRAGGGRQGRGSKAGPGWRGQGTSDGMAVFSQNSHFNFYRPGASPY